MPTYGPFIPTTASQPTAISGEVEWGLTPFEVDTLDGVFTGVDPWIDNPPPPSAATELVAAVSTRVLFEDWEDSGSPIAIPSDEIVTRILLSIHRRIEPAHYPGTGVQDSEVYLAFSGSQAGINRAAADAWPAVVTEKQYDGSPSDWGISNNPALWVDFGLLLRVAGTGGPAALPLTDDEPAIAQLDYIQLVIETGYPVHEKFLIVPPFSPKVF